jgi:hypothetical protein
MPAVWGYTHPLRQAGQTVNGIEEVTTWDDAEELLTASRFGDVARHFGGLNDLAQIGQLRLQRLDRLRYLDSFSACFAFSHSTRFHLYSA